MLFDWFNAQEAAAVGTSLADYLLPESGSVPKGRPKSGSRGGHDLQKFLQRVAREAGPLKLNLFKRARLLNSFKWRLLEHGYDRSVADELTEAVLLQLCGNRLGVPAAQRETRRVRAPVKARSSPRIALLLTEADAQFAKAEYAEVMDRLRQVLELDPDHSFARNKLGATLYHLGRYQEAEQEFRRAIELKPTFAEAHFNLGSLLCRKGDFVAAETALRKAVKIDPTNAEAQVALGVTLGNAGRLGDARVCYEKALRVQPRNASALCGLGYLAGIDGRFEEAEKFYRSALEAEPKKAYAWASIADLRRMTSADREWLENVKRLLSEGVSPLDEASLRFALGKYFDDVGKYSEAFPQYKRANELHKAVAKPYDRVARTALVDDMIRICTPERLAKPRQGASDSTRPVFVVGMMRSGTSLVEQIIASHPQVAGAGELDFWNETVHKRRETFKSDLPDAALTSKLAAAYLKILDRHSRDAQRVIDKSTFNSDCLGLIHSVLPKSRFIYVQRDPVDTCLSCYFQHFANAASFTMDLADLAHYYREHHRLMQHWRSSLPAGTLLEVPYADLVRDQEAWSRKLVEFIGLDWDPRCLDFHKTERSVLTASNWQVRQRIYSNSVGRWRNYEKFIGPLLELRKLA